MPPRLLERRLGSGESQLELAVRGDLYVVFLFLQVQHVGGIVDLVQKGFRLSEATG